MALHPNFPESPHEIIAPSVHGETTTTAVMPKQAIKRLRL